MIHTYFLYPLVFGDIFGALSREDDEMAAEIWPMRLCDYRQEYRHI